MTQDRGARKPNAHANPRSQTLKCNHENKKRFVDTVSVVVVMNARFKNWWYWGEDKDGNIYSQFRGKKPKGGYGFRKKIPWLLIGKNER